MSKRPFQVLKGVILPTGRSALYVSRDGCALIDIGLRVDHGRNATREFLVYYGADS